ncbi:MAG: MFS transporter [Candidatus Melainabacteria bacterium]|nr:MFS transporter [Candidatus Melainabacteria bacterium]
MNLIETLIRWFGSPNNREREFGKTFRSLSNRNFRVYSIGQVISLCGTWMQITALPWLVYTMTDSAAALGVVSFAGSVPLLLLTYFGGTLADRFDRRRVLLAMQTLAMLQAVVLFTLVATGTISFPLIVALALLGGCITALDLPTRQAFVPDLVDKAHLTNATALNSAVWNTCRMIGPALAGVLIGIFGEAICFGINAVSFIASLVTLTMIRVNPEEKAAPEQNPAPGTSKPIEAPGLMSVLLSPPVVTVLLLSVATGMFGFQYSILLPVIVDRLLGGSASTLGFLSAAAGVGALVGSLALASKPDNQNLRRIIGLAPLALAVAITIVALSPWTTLSLVALALGGVSISVQLSGGLSLVQMAVPSEKRGRIMGVYSTCMLGFTPFAAMLAGWLASSVGVTYTLLLSAAIVAVAATIYLSVASRIIHLDGDRES